MIFKQDIKLSLLLHFLIFFYIWVNKMAEECIVLSSILMNRLFDRSSLF